MKERDAHDKQRHAEYWQARREAVRQRKRERIDDEWKVHLITGRAGQTMSSVRRGFVCRVLCENLRVGLLVGGRTCESLHRVGRAGQCVTACESLQISQNYTIPP